MVLVHGLGKRGASWDEVAEAFAATHRVYALDLRGHGDSDWPGTYSLELMRDDTIGFCDALGLAGVTLVGHSAGGIVSYLLAQVRPDLVGRLVLEEAPVLSAAVPTRAVPDRPAAPLTFDWALVEPIYQQRNNADPAWAAGLTKVAAATLAIAGGRDSHIPFACLVDLADRIPDCQLVTIPAGHDVHERRPVEFVAAVDEFLTSRAAAGR